MIIHDATFFDIIIPLLLFWGTIGGLVASVVLLLALKIRLARRVFLGTVAVLSAFSAIFAVLTALAPQTIVKVGDSYCYDSWCLGVTNVTAATRTQDVAYKVDVRAFSDAGRGKQEPRGIPFLIDERGRRFPLIHDPAVVPVDQALDPGQAINTTMTFAVPPDSRQLFLMKDEKPGVPGIVLVFAGLWPAYTLHKPALLRVL